MTLEEQPSGGHLGCVPWISAQLAEPGHQAKLFYSPRAGRVTQIAHQESEAQGHAPTLPRREFVTLGQNYSKHQDKNVIEGAVVDPGAGPR